jgi:hypothetical protein
MCLRRAPEKYIAGAALDRAGVLSLSGKSGFPQAMFHSPQKEGDVRAGIYRGSRMSICILSLRNGFLGRWRLPRNRHGESGIGERAT